MTASEGRHPMKGRASKGAQVFPQRQDPHRDSSPYRSVVFIRVHFKLIETTVGREATPEHDQVADINYVAGF